MRALNEALSDLIRELTLNSIDSSKTANIVKRWAHNHFERFGIVTALDYEEKNNAEYKAHLVRKQAMDASLEIAKQCAFGEEEIKMDWPDQVSFRNKDYRPAWRPRSNMPYVELRMEFVALRRKPVSWYKNESVDAWMSRLKESPHPTDDSEK